MTQTTGLSAEEVGRLLAEWQERLYALALNILGNPADAEDAIQNAALAIIRGAGSVRRGEPVGPWVWRVATNAAVDVLRRRRGKEETMKEEPVAREAHNIDAAELRAVVRAAVQGLPEAERVCVVLHYFQGLGYREVAGVLGKPEGTVSTQIKRGRERLRARLAEFGGVLAILPAATLEGAMADAGGAQVPARLSEWLARRACSKAVITTKGGMVMKLVAGIVLAGAFAAGLAFVSGRGGGALLAEQAKFSIPIWHPDARWSAKTETDVGSGAIGVLDGPRRETMSAWAIPSRRMIGGPAAGPYGYLSYDPNIDRIHFVAGSARGYLDGPFSRVRLASHSYSQVRKSASSERYAYCTEPQNGGILRRLDFVEQQVTTVPMPAGVKGFAGMTCDSTGRLYFLPKWSSGLYILSPDGKVEKKAVEMKESTGGFSGLSLAVDEKHNRLYCSGYGAKKWYVYYWDLKDGSFHGVLPVPQKGEPRRKRSEAGPFKGTELYNQMGCSFGADDPEKRFLYVYPNDTQTIFRLDLEKKEIWGCSVGKDGVRFISSGVPRRFSGWSARFNMTGDLCTDVPFWGMPRMLRHPRIK